MNAKKKKKMKNEREKYGMMQKKVCAQRGQATLPDVLLATFIFLLILVGLYSYAQNVLLSSEETLERRSLDVVTANTAEFILKNPGLPTNWEELNDISLVTQFGLAQKDRVLDQDKVVAFVNYGNLSYAETKTKLNIPQYDFYAQFEGGISLSTGLPPAGTIPTSVVQRLVTINGVETIFTLTLYES